MSVSPGLIATRIPPVSICSTSRRSQSRPPPTRELRRLCGLRHPADLTHAPPASQTSTYKPGPSRTHGSSDAHNCLRAGAGICRPRRVRGSLCPVGERALLGPAPTSWPHVVWGRHDVGAGPGDERLERAAIGVRLVGQSGNSAGCTSRPLVGLVRRRGALHGSVLRRGRSRRTRRGPQSPRRA